MSSTDPNVRSQRLALLESYLNGTAYQNAPYFSISTQSENQLPSLQTSNFQNIPDGKKSPNPPTLPSLNEFIKPIFHSSSQSSSSDSSSFHPHKSSNGPSNSSVPSHMSNGQSRYSLQGNFLVAW
mmetsp:Transcript_16929/g.23561  ORF Transcript_16929/g.23561 Transcript_16929/m.23561 type:complete len:125 (+) Transcript_16929:64-438(+)